MRLFHYAALVFVILVFASNAHAKWKPAYSTADPKIAAWFSNQHNQKGAWCCDQSDGHEYDGNYTLLSDGSVDIDYGYGEHFLLPDYKILTGPNPTGHAVWWYVDR